MKYKIDFTFTLVLILFGILYSVLAFSWYVLPGKLNLEAMYFPAIALMYIFAAYLTYLVKVAIPPYIATSVLAIVFTFSLANLNQNQSLGVEG